MADWNLIAQKIKEADAILIGASNGLSITEGLHLFADNEAFEKLFGDFKRKVGLLGASYPPLLWTVPSYAGDGSSESHCRRKRLLCRHIKRRRSL